MDSKALMNYKSWLHDPSIDEDTKVELESIKDNPQEIEDRFFMDLEFGTAGLRGIMAAGTNRMNKYVGRKNAQGLANYIISKGDGAKARGVAIAYDSRKMSKEFAQESSYVLAGNGVKVYLFDELKPTPELSFAIRHLGCISGIVITASHNPAEYNGLKIYWEDGAQIAGARARGIIDEISMAANLKNIRTLTKEKAEARGLLTYIGNNLDDVYLGEVKKQLLRADIIEKAAHDFKIVYTPLYGTGNAPIRRILNEVGFKKVMVVREQEMPDHRFPTVKYPNPKNKKAFRLAIELAKKENANLIIGTDPDCDRIGVLVKEDAGGYTLLSGNQIGALLVEYILKTLNEKDLLPENGVIIKTIVTSEMGADIAKGYGIKTINTLTGFKYIGEKINEFEQMGEKTFLLGYEESCGYLVGTYARDKDAVVSAMLISEMAAYYHLRGMNLYDAVTNLYNKYGYYLEDLKSITLEGKEGMNLISMIMKNFRKSKMKTIGDKKILCIEDYDSQIRTYLSTPNHSEKIELPRADVVKFILEKGHWVCLRPSGTEPKLKIYSGVKGDKLNESKRELAALTCWAEEKIFSFFPGKKIST